MKTRCQFVLLGNIVSVIVQQTLIKETVKFTPNFLKNIENILDSVVGGWHKWIQK